MPTAGTNRRSRAFTPRSGSSFETTHKLSWETASHLSRPHAGAILLALVCAASTYTGAGIRFAGAQSAGIEELVDEHGVTPKFELTSAQRHAIYQDLHKERSKLAPSLFAARVGADVPPIIELHALPDHVLASNPETKLYKFTKVDDQVVLVDPTNMRVIAVMNSKAKD